MTTQDLSSGNLLSSDVDQHTLKLQALRSEFPLGLAPYDRGRLVSFGFWGGIVGAGIAGVVNLRRSNQSRFIPALLLITLVVLLLSEIVLSVILERIVLSGTTLDQNAILLIAIPINAVFGMGFAAWIAGRQRSISQRWFDLAGTPRLSDQGGCLTAISWVILSMIVAGLVASIVYPLVVQMTVQVTSPQHTYTADGISVTVPSGWEPVAPSSIGANCQANGVTCLTIVSDQYTGSLAIFEVVSGVTPQFLGNQVVYGLVSKYPSLPAQQMQPYTSASLKARAAIAFSVNLNDRTFVYTGIEDNGRTVAFTLTCVGNLQPQCEARRDQFVSTLTFSASSGTPVPLPIQ